MRVFSEQATHTTLLEVKPEGSNQWIPCFETKLQSLDFKVHPYITTGGREGRRKAHYVHSIKFYDNEVENEAEQE